MRSEHSNRNRQSSNPPETLQLMTSSISLTEEYAAKYRRPAKINKDIQNQQKKIKKTQINQDKQQQISANDKDKVSSIFISLQRSTGDHSLVNQQKLSNNMENQKDQKSNNNKNCVNIQQNVDKLPLLPLRQNSVSLYKQINLLKNPQRSSQKQQNPTSLSTAFSILGRKFKSRLSFGTTIQTQQQIQLQIKNNFNSLNSMIESTSKYFSDRIKSHEDELLKVMKVQIKNIQQECQRTVNKFNQMIHKKMNGHELRELNEELELYKIKLQEMHNENLQLKRSLKQIKKLNQEYQRKMQSDHETLFKLKKKLMNQKKKSSQIMYEVIESIFISRNKQKTQELPSIKICPSKNNQSSSGKYRSNTQIETEEKQRNHENQDNIKSFSTLLTLEKSKNSIKKSLIINPQTKCHSNHYNSTTSLQKLNKQLDRRYKLTPKVQQQFMTNQTINESLQINENNYCSNRQKIVDYLSIPSKQQNQKKINNLIKKRECLSLNYKQYIRKLKNKVDITSLGEQKWKNFKKNPLFIQLKNDEYRLKQQQDNAY